MNQAFSGLLRSKVQDKMKNKQYDLVIIGGGITGAGIALDAALRGLKTALVEKQDFAAGTSSRSTKLVHGGLRYLKQFQVGLVAEVGKEREIVYRNGPHVTTPERMLLPIYKTGNFGKFSTSVGIWIYDILAGVKPAERRKMLTWDETLQAEPLLKKEGLLGGASYVEYRTDDARLTIEVAKAAFESGADLVNYTKFEDFIYDDGKISGIKVRDMITEESFTIRARIVVNASGPWVDEVRSRDRITNNKRLQLSKGIHIVIDQKIFPLKQSVYFDTPDGRMIFAIPRDGKTYVGTTDTFYEGDPAHPQMTKADMDYLLEAIRFMFPSLEIDEQAVESSWAGVRPLIYEEGKSPSEISRKDEIWEGESGLITIAGGKLTGFRKMAENVVDLVMKKLQETDRIQYQSCKTMHFPIAGGNIKGNLAGFLKEKGEEAVQYGLLEEEGMILAKRYGTNVDLVFEYAEKYFDKYHDLLPAFVYAQLLYGIHHEMVVKPIDFFIRRTGALFFDIRWVQKWKEPVISVMADVMNWSNGQKEAYELELDQAIMTATQPADDFEKVK